jgi:DNA polymerase-4
VTVKIRLHDFSTHTRSATLPAPTDDPRVISRLSRTLLGEVDTSGGVRLLGVGVSGLADWIQEGLFADESDPGEEPDAVLPELPAARTTWAPGMDVVHDVHGAGWVWGSGKDVVTVRFETAETGPGKVASFSLDDPALTSLHQPRR